MLLNNEEINTLKTIKNYTTEERLERIKYLFTLYTTTIKVTHYLMIFIYCKKVYSIKIKHNELTEDMVKLSTESKGGIKLMLRITKEIKEQWIASGKATYICTEKYFNKQVKESKYNKGEIAEKIVTEKRGQQWKKDNVRYDKAGDINLKRDSIQVKFQNASLTSAKTMLKVASAN